MGRNAVWPPRLVNKPGTTEARTHYSGRWWSCGAWDTGTNKPTQAAREKHARLIAMWAVDPDAVLRPAGEYLVADLLAEWIVSPSGPRSQVKRYQTTAMIRTLEPWADTPAAQFRLPHLTQWQEQFATILTYRKKLYSISTIKSFRSLIGEIFGWGELRDKVPFGTRAHLRMLCSTKIRHGANEKRRLPADSAAVKALYRHYAGTGKPAIAGLVAALWFTGARVQELTRLTVGQLHRGPKLETASGVKVNLAKYGVWAASLVEHKNADRGTDRVLFFGPRLQRIMAKLGLLERDPAKLLFDLHLDAYPGRVVSGSVGHEYTAGFLCSSFIKATGRLGVRRTTPRQLRTAAAHRVQARLGRDAARAFLGHSLSGNTDRYTGEDFVTASKVSRKLG